jgi:hypothetical protein
MTLDNIFLHNISTTLSFACTELHGWTVTLALAVPPSRKR